MKTFTINWSHLKNIDDFYNQIEWLFLQNSDLKFWRNLDALNDILYWWFWSFEQEENIKIIWNDFNISKKYIKEIDLIEEIISENSHIKFIKA